VSAELREQTGTGVETVENIKRIDTATGTAPRAVFHSNNSNGSSVAPNQSRGDDSDYADVPPFAGNDEAEVFFCIEGFVNFLNRFLNDLFFDGLPLAVGLIEKAGLFISGCRKIRQKEFKGSVSATDATRGIDTRPKSKPSVVHFDGSSHSGQFFKRVPSRIFRIFQGLETGADQCPVVTE